MFNRFPKLAALLLMGAFACCEVAGSQGASGLANDDHVIVPGERVGPIRLGMTEADLLKLGTPSDRQLRETSVGTPPLGWSGPGVIYWYGQELQVHVNSETHKVVQIHVGRKGNCLGYHTANGISCDSQADDVVSAYGKPGTEQCDRFAHPRYMKYVSGQAASTVFSFERAPTGTGAAMQEVDLCEGPLGYCRPLDLFTQPSASPRGCNSDGSCRPLVISTKEAAPPRFNEGAEKADTWRCNSTHPKG